MARAKISAVGAYLPDHILSNTDLEKMVDTSDEWIFSRTGVRERRILKDKTKATSDIGVAAVKEILEKSNTDPADIELIICTTVTPDYVFPATANLIADRAGLKNAFGYDLNAACSGFLYGLTTGAQFIEAGTHKKVIVVGADKMSSIINYGDRTTCILFGDGGGGVLLEPDESGEDLGIIDSIMKSDGSGWEFLHQKSGGSLNPPSYETIDRQEHFVYQEGKNVFKSAVVNMADVSEEIMKRNNLDSDDVDWLVPHQANLRIIEATRARTGIAQEKVMINIEKYGNTTNGTIPLCLWEWENKLNKGDKLILSAFGGGFTWGSIYLKWAYDS
ncbi:MAG: ketoacyl-ACP synthase III [Chitinophagales bacterium]|nr:ketoacyl-ACP synthase III [Chitinophagales bacterium]